MSTSGSQRQKMKYIHHAWRHTFASLGGMQLFLTLLAIPTVGFFLHQWQAGTAAVKPELQTWVIYGLEATGVVFFVLFILNLARAPFLIERDAHKATTAERDILKAQVTKKVSRRLLTAEQKGIFADRIRSSNPRPSQIHVVYYPTSEESSDFAEDIADAIRSAGIESVAHNGVVYNHNSKDRGIKINYPKDIATDSDLASSIQETFKELGFSSEKRPQEESDSFCIYIARSSSEI
jgi:hypothetical protein